MLYKPTFLYTQLLKKNDPKQADFYLFIFNLILFLNFT